MSQQAPRILIFDSGVGGLSIVEAIMQQHPNCSVIYASDNEAFPYGIKKESVLVDRVDRVLHQLQSISRADIIVVACNTASTVVLPKIRERFSLPIIGVVPAIKPAAKVSPNKIIGLLATPGTIERSYTHELINKFASDCHIVSVGSSELVSIAEDKLRGKPIDIEQLKQIVSPLLAQPKLDTVVLACTHFPLLKKELIPILPKVSHWVDSGDAIARRTGYWLSELSLPTENSEKPIHSSVFTAQTNEVKQLTQTLTERQLGNIQFVSVL
ncbi:MAG: glutamate racemase [Cellvibrionaceae bacterium]